MIQVTDTHRLQYRNATLVAYLYSNLTTRLDFFDPNGNNLGDTLHTNDKGYIAAGTGSDILQGYFVKQSALIVCTLSDGTTVQWATNVENNVVNDGKLLGLHDEEIFSANEPEDKPNFDYLKLLNQPKLKAWREGQQTIAVGTWGETFSIPKWATVLKIQDLADCLDSARCSYRKCIYLARPDRPGQQLLVVSETGSDTILLNEGVSLPDQTDPLGQYTNAISVLDAFEGVTLASVYTRDNTYEWKAVSKTSLFNLSGGRNGFQHVHLAAQITPEVNIQPETQVLLVSSSYAGAAAIQLLFSKAGQNVVVVNSTVSTLYLCNAVPSTPNSENSVCEIAGMSNSDPSSAARRNTTVIGSGILSDNIIRFWGMNSTASSGSGSSSGGKLQVKTFAPITSVTGNSNINLGNLTIDEDATALEIKINVSGITATTSEAITLSFYVYINGTKNGQVLGVCMPSVFGSPTISGGGSVGYDSLAFGQHWSIKERSYTDGVENPTTWGNHDDELMVHGGLPINSWQVTGSDYTKCTALFIAQCGNAPRDVATTYTDEELVPHDVTTVIDMRFTDAAATSSVSDNSELWEDPSVVWTSEH